MNSVNIELFSNKIQTASEYILKLFQFGYKCREKIKYRRIYISHKVFYFSFFARNNIFCTHTGNLEHFIGK